MPTTPTGTACIASTTGIRLLAGVSLAVSAVAQLQWEQRPVFGRFSAPVAYDVNRARLVLYWGGTYVPTAETWEWDGVAWQSRTPAQMPPSRAWPALAYDVQRGRTVLFGGGGGGQSNDTWEWDGTTWFAKQPTTVPPARRGAAMAFDVSRGRAVLFGGEAGFVFTPPYTTFFADTWEWDGVNWTNRASTATPPTRSWHGMTYDVLRNRIVLFGGKSSVGYRNDTWEWDGTNWAQRPTVQQPSPRSNFALAYDVARGRSVLFGGLTAGNDTWEWDGTNWLQAVPPVAPPARSDAGLAYDVAHGGVLMVGGHSGSTATGSTTFGDTWRWDGVQWTRLDGPSGPSPRVAAAFAWDKAASAMLLFGGVTDYQTTYLDDCWQWDGQHWLELQPPVRPSARSGALTVYDSIRHRIVLFGGKSSVSSFYLNDTWEWDGATWRLVAVGGPSPRGFSAMVFDPIRGQTVKFGGVTAPPLPPTCYAETSLWDGAVWRQPPLTLEPSPRSSPGMAFDERRGVTVLFGGMGPSVYVPNPLADTWEWNGSAWLQRTPVHAPPAGYGTQMIWDAARERVVFYSGIDAWDWDGIDWQQRALAQTPPSRGSGSAFAYDRARERAVLFGGQNSSDLAELWELGPVQPARVTPFGSGCAGTLGAPLLDVVDAARPWLGDAITLRLSPVVNGAVAMFALGSSNTQWAGAPLPAPLDGLGMPGCALFVGVDETFVVAGSGGTALLTATVPTQPALLGLSLYLQGAVADPGANARGIIVSNALAFLVGAR